MDKATAACTNFLVIVSLFSIIDRIILLEVVDYIFFNFIRQVVCVGSIDELEQFSGVRVSDLHRERYNFLL